MKFAASLRLQNPKGSSYLSQSPRNHFIQDRPFCDILIRVRYMGRDDRRWCRRDSQLRASAGTSTVIHVKATLVAILLGIARQIAVSGRSGFRKLFSGNNLQSVRLNRAILTRFRCPPYSSLQCMTLELTRQDGKSIRGINATRNRLVDS